MPATNRPTGEFTPPGPAGLMANQVLAAEPACTMVLVGMAPSTALLESASTPLNKADQAARPAWEEGFSESTFTESWPRVALSLGAVEKISNNIRSWAGVALPASKELPFPVQASQELVPM